jgi:hypothetical protein
MDKYIRAGAVALVATVIVGTAGVAVARNGGDDTPDPVSTTSSTPAPTPTHGMGDDKGGMRDRDDRDEPGDDCDGDDRAGRDDATDDKGGMRDRDDRDERGDDRDDRGDRDDDSGHHGQHGDDD